MIQTKTLRCIIGILGMALPWIVLFQSILFGYPFPNSISATYFVPTCIAPFMIILGSAGILLFTYKGYDWMDNILNTIAGIFAWGVCLFPTAAASGNIGTFATPAAISDKIHLISALGFFGILAYNSLFQFTQGVGEPTPNKKKRNIIFIICGIGMIISFGLLPLVNFGIINIPNVFWWIEMFALTFFGISWLTKANCIPFLFADKE